VSLHIAKFIERIRSNEHKGKRDLVITMQEAKDLHADITKLLLALEELRQAQDNTEDQVVEVKITGGNF
jgi:hypothetical protein